MGNERRAPARKRKPLPAAYAWLFLGAGFAAMAAYLAIPPAGLAITVGMAALSVAASLLGLLRNETPGPRRRPWFAFALAMAVYLLGAGVRSLNPAGSVGLSDAVILPGYVVAGWGLLDMLRRRRGTADRLARVDGLLIGLGAALATWSLWMAPRVEAHLYSGSSLLSTLYPLADVVLLVLAMQLAVADGVRQPALWLLMTSFGAIFALDLVYAMFDAGGSGDLLDLFNLISILAYVTGGAAALHPTMRSLGDPQTVITRTLGPARFVGLTLVVVAPTVFAYLIPAISWWNKLGRVAFVLVLAVVITRRISRSQASQAAAEAAERHRSTHDALTDLPNRELLTETITRWANADDVEGKEISLLFLDLDRFKSVNDNWGHRVGDELLGAVAGRLAGMVRSEDLVCRIGGDEFVIAFASPSHTALAESLARRIVEEFKAPFQLSVGEVYVAPSIGVVRASGAAEALELIRDADLAMYQAKDSGGNTYALYDGSLRERAQARVQMEQALRGALGRGELSVHYQPIVRAADGAVTGFEALMRWTSPELGFVSPDKFIPVAESTGLILSSGAWLLDTAVDQLARWRRDRDPDFAPLHMSVNIATRQLRDPELVTVVRRALERTGLPPSALWLEVTESVLLKDAERSLATLEQLRELGVTLCIDDFGTGYASLSYVREIPASITKIDKRFINGIGVEENDEAIVIAVIAMAHAVGQQVVAEGVETAEQRAWLAERGCDLIQGWLFGRPRPAADQDAWSKHFLTPILPASAAASA